MYNTVPFQLFLQHCQARVYGTCRCVKKTAKIKVRNIVGPRIREARLRCCGPATACITRFDIISSIGLPGNLAATPDAAILRSGFPGQLNEPPSVTSDYVTALRGHSLNILISTLILNDSDAEGDAIRFVTLPPASANGVPLSRMGDSVVYDAPPGSVLADSFTYTISDGIDSNVGTVFVGISQTERITLSILLQGPERSTVVRIYGSPGRTYQLQTTIDLAAPIAWTNLGRPSIAPPDGLVELFGTTSEPQRFYRVVEL